MFRITPRFSLRALLVVVLTCAPAAWGYWIFWPKWVAYREAVNFERMAMDLRAGEPGKPSTEVERDSAEQFLSDFYEIATGREAGDLGIAYELIHADSLAATK